MTTKLERIAQIARENPKEKFTSLAHLLDENMLIQCHKELDRHKASGIDEVTKTEYEVNLYENIKNLLERMKSHKYKPQPVRRVYIPKVGSNKMRPLGIPSYEDKIVQLALNKIISAIFEQDFLNSSFGFRPQRGCHDALKILNVYICGRNINYIVDADIKGFFDHVDHGWMMKFLEERIKDPNILRLVAKFLKSGIMENGAFQKTYEGTPQGGILSPALGNIYLHYTLDLWFEKVVRKRCKGSAYIVRYADDSVACFQYESEAKRYYKALVERLAKFNLEVAEEKTRIIYFGERAYLECKNGYDEDRRKKPQTFDFLGFTHYCSCRSNGSFRVKRKTSRKKFIYSLKRCKQWLKENRILPVSEIMKKLSLKLTGYYRYYGITDNMQALWDYKRIVRRMLFKWLNRRSNKRSFSREHFSDFLKLYPLPNPKLYDSIFELKKDLSYIM